MDLRHSDFIRIQSKASSGMPTSKWFDETSKKKSGTMRGSRRSARLRKPELDITAEDPDETMLDESKSLLSDDDIAGDDRGGEDGPKKPDAMEVDDNFVVADNGQKGDTPPLNMRGGAGGFLSNDPLTSSTMKSSQSTTFSELRRPDYWNKKDERKKNNTSRINTSRTTNTSRVNTSKAAAPTKKKDVSNSEAWGDDSDDSEASDEEFRREVARRNAANRARLEREESQEREARQKEKEPSNSSRVDQSLRTQAQQANNESEDTARMGNRGEATSKNSPSLSETFAATQDWEKEVGGLPDAPVKDNRQRDDSMEVERPNDQAKQAAPKSSSSRSQGALRKEDTRREQRREESRPNQQRKQAASSNGPHQGNSEETMMDVSPKKSKKEQRVEAKARAKAWHDARGGDARATNNGARAPDLDAATVQEKEQRREDQRHDEPRRQAASTSFSNNHQNDSRGHRGEEQQRQNHQQHAPRQDHRRRAQLMQEQLEEQYNASDKLRSSHESQQNDRHRQGRHDRQRNDEGSYNPQFQSRNLGSGAVSNPYHRRQPPPPTKRASINVPKIALENLKSARKSRKGRSRIDHSYDDMNIENSAEDDETWQEETFRSSLLDLLGSFPSSYFASQDASMDDNEGSLFATSATENADDHSPHSTTSQSAASAQLQRKRLFEEAARSLARLAIASRHPSKQRNGNHTSRSSDGESAPDFNPPSPRSLPSYMSVMNVHDDSGPFFRGHWGGNANAMLASSKEVFSGRSVHGRNARTVRLSTVREGNDVPSSNPFSPWTLEELAYGSMVLAAQVCLEASFDPNFDSNSSSGEAESCRVAGFAQNSSSAGGKGKTPIVSSALVESALGFLATSFGCLEADFVYSVLKSALKASSDATVFDALSHFAPTSSHSLSTREASTIPSLSLLALSRGLEAALYVARYATTLDPSSACVAYAAPHQSISGTVDTGVDEGSVGWLSALGRDLGLKLEVARTSRPRHLHLRDIAAQAYDFILDFDFSPQIVDDAPGLSRRNDRESQRRANSRGGLYIDTQVDQGGLGAVCRLSSVVNDRLYAANVEYLSSTIQGGLVSGWLSCDSALDDGDGTNESNDARTVGKLCQKLLFVIDTRARLRRSTNQHTSNSDSGDSEAVCAASLSLLALVLPKHVEESAPSSLSRSFRQMGNAEATVADVVQSPLVRKMVEMALSWQDASSGNERDAGMKCRATTNAIYVLADICLAGGSSLITSQFQASVDNFLHDVTESICRRGKGGPDGDRSEDSIEPPLMLLLQLHTGSPVLVRQFVRSFIEQSSEGADDCASCFVSGLLKLSASQSFSTSACASSLLRALVYGNPVDRTQDRLSERMLSSLDAEHVGVTLEGALRALVDVTYSTVHCNAPAFSCRWHPRLCSLGDLLGVCIHSFTATEIFASSLSVEALSLFANVLDRSINDSLGGAAQLSLLRLFASFVNVDCQNEQPTLAQQRNVEGQLLRSSSFLPALEFAMAQGASADLTHRSLKLQHSLASLTDERAFALTFTKASDSVARKEGVLLSKLARSEAELTELSSKYREMESDHDTLANSLHDQKLAYERQLEWTRSEARRIARGGSEIHVRERRQAEEQCAEEKELREIAERENDQLKHESTSDKARIEELEALLAQEHKSRQHFESSLEEIQNQLSTTSEELERTLNNCDDLEEKLALSEENVAELSERYEDAQACLEENCEKLIRIAAIFQYKEAEADKHKAELRHAVKTADNEADAAIKKYERAKKEIFSLKEEIKTLKAESKEKADVRRMRKNAPVAYLNNVVRGKENSLSKER